MATPSSQSFQKRRTRYVRDVDGRIIEMRVFDEKAKLGNYCYSININRDPSTKLIIGFFNEGSKVTQDDLNATT